MSNSVGSITNEERYFIMCEMNCELWNKLIFISNEDIALKLRKILSDKKSMTHLTLSLFYIQVPSAAIVDLLLWEIAISSANINQKHTEKNQITKRLKVIPDNSKSELRIWKMW